MDEMRTPSNKDWKDERSIGRRDADRGVCLYHDICHETMATMKQDCINLEVNMKTKLDWKVFALFVGGVVTLGIAFVLFIAPLVLNMAQAITRVDTKVQHIVEELAVKPVK